MRRWALGLVLIVMGVAAGCNSSAEDARARTPTTQPSPIDSSIVRLLFAGDVMLGRRVGPVLVADGSAVLEGVRHVVSSADVAAANLESPLTDLPHISPDPNVLKADPDVAGLLAGAGFDLMSLANNHSGDAGAEGLMETMEALSLAGIRPLGAGRAISEVSRVVEMVVNGVRVSHLAFDATGLGLEAGETTPGVIRYDRPIARAVVERAAATSDIVAVGVHGGVEYLTQEDPILGDISRDLIGWGADVVWCHGPHVPQPVSIVDGRAIVATSLGNFLFDQQRPVTQTGLILEVLASRQGIEAFRVGRVDHGDLRAEFTGWDLPDGPAVLIDTEWWSLLSIPEPPPQQEVSLEEFPLGDVVHATLGDATGDGWEDLVVSYRHPFRTNEVNTLYPDRVFADSLGRSAHLGVFEYHTLKPIWAAGTLVRPVAEVAACDGSIALAFDSLDDPGIVATGGWKWWDFGFAAAPELPDVGSPACFDVDRDGLAEPVILPD
jgi:poly-gamma-glutamate synthesis protein (capsule biosynthesis protein)